jgi:uncharacterized protein
MPASSNGQKPLFLVVLRTGMNQPGQVRAALMYASLAAAMDQEVVVYCVQEGADPFKQGVMETEPVKDGAPTIKERFQEALEMGVRVEVCEQTASVRKIKAEELVEGAVMRGGASLIDYAMQAKGTLTF